MLDGNTKLRVPCALKHYLREVDYQISFVQHSLPERRLAFEHWVAFNSKTISKAISNKGDFVCPLLPCLEHFENLEFCLQHLLHCPHLSGASYWCPFCKDRENFAAPQPSRDYDLSSSWDNKTLVVPQSSRGSPALKKSTLSNLKRFIAALTKLFRRNSSKAARNDSVPHSSHELPPKVHELPPKVHELPPKVPELSATDSSEAARNDSVPDLYHCEPSPVVSELSTRGTVYELDVLQCQRSNF
ncbi:hypothetical protein MMC29_005208 [Sticta canariensis]|nr:hypothetical protein [Sticta canariensis]